MCSRSLKTLLVAFIFILPPSGCVRPKQSERKQKRALRVCADPNNLPFSNDRGQGFENRIADLIADELGAKVEYTWFAQRRGFIRNTLGAGLCDVVMGMPAASEMVEATRPYYRSTYVFVSREDRNIDIRSFDDPRLKVLDIGVHLIGDDYANPPPLHALGQRQIIHNVAGYSIYGDYSKPNPPAKLIEAVAQKDVDIAIVWGPLGGFFAQHQQTPLRIVPVSPEIDSGSLPFVFDIAMGVRKGDRDRRAKLEHILDRRQGDINRILSEFGVPLKPMQRREGAEE